jgi:ATP-dependent Clp protease ATP-binding subunit ClpX
MEETLLGVMYEIPSKPEVERVIITPEVVLKQDSPTLITRPGGPKRASKAEKSEISEKGVEEKTA